MEMLSKQATIAGFHVAEGPLIFVFECLLLAVLCRIWKSDAWADRVGGLWSSWIAF